MRKLLTDAMQMAIGYDDRATRAMMHARTQGCRMLLGHGRMGGERRRWWTVGPTDGNGVLAPNAKTAAAAELVAPACAVMGSGAGALPSRRAWQPRPGAWRGRCVAVQRDACHGLERCESDQRHLILTSRTVKLVDSH